MVLPAQAAQRENSFTIQTIVEHVQMINMLTHLRHAHFAAPIVQPALIHQRTALLAAYFLHPKAICTQTKSVTLTVLQGRMNLTTVAAMNALLVLQAVLHVTWLTVPSNALSALLLLASNFT